eukprot:CAMPEP_0170529538 /NCGR_PEP_ID=MMETSP0209-20121228/24533_1 /TAXON_ID=665100 ORGANISM="Litonotus pictus, Strain P1" /NCGR_SAMPLE_ID=MMETSP0209 /ASSEMBLY_ACC=CAM_ASM_000301 /LENGTH=519 /DNA_ID=CAMNT_0010821615 /DNA_START=26 /DNA_END=1585 /DNA_ORIENTATION=-
MKDLKGLNKIISTAPIGTQMIINPPEKIPKQFSSKINLVNSKIEIPCLAPQSQHIISANSNYSSNSGGLTIKTSNSNISNFSLIEGCHEWYLNHDSFDSMDLKTNVLRGIYNCGYDKPTLIQQKVIVPILENNDIIALAQSATGKSSSIIISLLEKIDQKLTDQIQAIVLSPTRELAQRFSKSIKKMGEYMEHIKVHAFIGGTSIKADIKSISEGVNIVVGTPSRILDLLNKQILKLKSEALKMFIIEDANEMHNRGFVDHIKLVMNYIPKKMRIAKQSKDLEFCEENIEEFNRGNKETQVRRGTESSEVALSDDSQSTKPQIIVFSNTPPKEVISAIKPWMMNPLQISSKNEKLSLEGVRQYYLIVEPDYKTELLLNLYKMIDINQALVFSNNKKTVEIINLELSKRGFAVSVYHPELIQQEKEKQLKDFKQGLTRVLVTTDCLTRNFDVYQIDLLVNYDIPNSKDFYINRIGRSRKYGRKGIAINFITNEQKDFLEEIEDHYDIKIGELPNDLTSIK